MTTFKREYVSVDEAEQLTSISKWTWRRWAYAGKIASCKIGKRLLIPVTEIERVIQEGMRERVEGGDKQ